MSDETWKAIKEAVAMAKSADCECDGELIECVPCRRWSEVQQAIPGLETEKQERDEARREADAMQGRMNRIEALCDEAADADWGRAICYFADISDIALEGIPYDRRGRRVAAKKEITVESSDYDKAAGILRARLRTTKEMKYITMGFESKKENEE